MSECSANVTPLLGLDPPGYSGDIHNILFNLDCEQVRDCYSNLSGDHELAHGRGYESQGDMLSSTFRVRLRTNPGVSGPKFTADWMPTHKQIELSSFKLKHELDRPFLWWRSGSFSPLNATAGIGSPRVCLINTNVLTCLHIDGLAHKRRSSSALAMELRASYTDP